jgi:hypothetical protein
MASGSAADGAATHQFRGDPFDSLPTIFFRQQVLDLGQETSLKTFGLAGSGPLNGQTLRELVIPSGSVPGVVARKTSFSGNPTQGNEYLPLQPVFRGTNSSFAELADAKDFTIRQDTDIVNRPAQCQGYDCMSSFVIGSTCVERNFHFSSLSNQCQMSLISRWGMLALPILASPHLAPQPTSMTPHSHVPINIRSIPVPPKLHANLLACDGGS